MPNALVAKYAKQHNMRVADVEDRWEKAKKIAAEKMTKKSDSYWAYTVAIFKHMFKESVSFKEFLLIESDQGQNKNDTAERAMIHKIVELNLSAGNMKGGKTEENLRLAYDFLESDWGGRLWDKHYELFREMHPDFEGPFNRRRYGDFKREAVAWFKSWKNKRALPADAKIPEPMHEAKSDLSVPEGTRGLLKQLGSEQAIMLKNGYYLKFDQVKPLKSFWNFERLLKDSPPKAERLYMVVARRGSEYIMQASGPQTEALTWEQRSRKGPYDELKPFDKQSMREFGISVLNAAKLITEDKKEDGVKKSYLKGLNAEEKKQMKQEIKRFSKMDHKDKAAYPDDWTADQKYKERLKKNGKKLPKSEHTKKFERMYGK